MSCDPMVGLSLHHIGVLVSDIVQRSEDYMRMGYLVRTAVIHDPRQTAFVRFLAKPGDPTYLELVAPDGPTSVLAAALKKGGGLHHLCFATDDIVCTLAVFRSWGAVVILEPTPSVAFCNNRIAWLLTRDHVLLELVERGTNLTLNFCLRQQC